MNCPLDCWTPVSSMVVLAPPVFTPTTRPQSSISGPPLLPALVAAVWKITGIREPPRMVAFDSSATLPWVR